MNIKNLYKEKSNTEFEKNIICKNNGEIEEISTELLVEHYTTLYVNDIEGQISISDYFTHIPPDFFISSDVVVYRVGHYVTGKKKSNCVFVVFGFSEVFLWGFFKRSFFGRFVYDIRSSAAGKEKECEKKN